MLPLYANDALENWKRFGGDDKAISSYIARTGSAANLTPQQIPAAPPSKMPPSAASLKTADNPMNVSPYLNPKGPGNMVAGVSTDALGQWVNENKPTDPGAYQGPAANSMYWGGSLIGGSRTGIEDYGNWRGQRDQYNQALQKWQQEYSEWERQKAAQQQPAPQAAGPAQPAQPSQPTMWGPASTQQQNLGQPQATAPTNPYAVPGQRTTQQPGTGPVQKPDKSLGKVNPNYTGVL